MDSLNQYTDSELKLIYRILHENLASNPELMDSDLLNDLQTLLQQKARQDGVDVSLHSQWAAWLSGLPQELS